jgi:hypothetical protein
MLWRFSPHRYTMRSFSIAMLALCAVCGFGVLALSESIDTARATSDLIQHSATIICM